MEVEVKVSFCLVDVNFLSFDIPHRHSLDQNLEKREF